MAGNKLIVGIGGTTRVGSTSEKALRIALGHCADMGMETQLFSGGDLPPEPYDPALPDRSDRAIALVNACRAAGGIILSTPAYHGGISGLIKNAIDYTEDMRGDDPAYLDGRAIGCIVCAAGPQAMGGTLASLRSIIHALRGWPTPYAATINSTTHPFLDSGEPSDPATAAALKTIAEQVVSFAKMKYLAD